MRGLVNGPHDIADAVLIVFSCIEPGYQSLKLSPTVHAEFIVAGIQWSGGRWTRRRRGRLRKRTGVQVGCLGRHST